MMMKLKKQKPGHKGTVEPVKKKIETNYDLSVPIPFRHSRSVRPVTSYQTASQISQKDWSVISDQISQPD
jgi:hypothetical protein